MREILLETNEEAFYKQLFKEFNKTENDLKECIEIMRKWTDTQPHFPEKPNNNTLKFVILYNKFSIEKAKQKLDMYYTIKNLMPEVYSRHPLSEEMILQSKITYCVPLPKVTENYERILYSQINPNFEADVFHHENFLIHIVHVLEFLIQEDSCYNFHYIFDCDGLKMAHIPKFSPMVLKKASIILESVYSNRVLSIYMVNFHPYMESLVNNIIKPMLNPKIKERMKVFSGTDILIEVFGKSRLPSDVGGEEPSLAELNELLIKKFEEHRERFDKLQKMRVDESLRPEKLINDDVSGYYGNFKQITVD